MPGCGCRHCWEPRHACREALPPQEVGAGGRPRSGSDPIMPFPASLGSLAARPRGRVQPPLWSAPPTMCPQARRALFHWGVRQAPLLWQPNRLSCGLGGDHRIPPPNLPSRHSRALQLLLTTPDSEKPQATRLLSQLSLNLAVGARAGPSAHPREQHQGRRGVSGMGNRSQHPKTFSQSSLPLFKKIYIFY